MEIAPGTDNGEDIFVTVTANVQENLTSEVNDNGGGVVGDEIAIPTATAFDNFTIPIVPIIELTPSLLLPDNASGIEDNIVDLGNITVDTTGSGDEDGSEFLFIEIEIASYPEGTVFEANDGTPLGTENTTGWLQIPAGSFEDMNLNPPGDFSGTINLTIRGLIVDAATDGDRDDQTTNNASFPVLVAPISDGVTSTVSLCIGVEDNGTIPFGSDFEAGITVNDDTSGTGNNVDTETISEIMVTIPADTTDVSYFVNGTFVPDTDGVFSGSNTAEVTYDSASRTYTITSTIITDVTDPATLSQSDRETAETDIRDTLDSFEVDMGPPDSDEDGYVLFNVTTLDVESGLFDLLSTSFNKTIRVEAVADTPELNVTSPAATVAEDIANVTINISVNTSSDADGSETLSIVITVPSDNNGIIGVMSGTPPTGVTMTETETGVYLIEAIGSTAEERRDLLNSFVDGGGLVFDPVENWAGNNTLQVELISTEAATGIQLADDVIYGGPDGDAQTETVSGFIDFIVTPVADGADVSIKGNSIGLEDTPIDVPYSVDLYDLDGSETFEVVFDTVYITNGVDVEIDGVDSDVQIFGEGGVEIFRDADGFYRLTPEDVAEFQVQAPLHYSTDIQGEIVLETITVVNDGPANASIPLNVTIDVTGVADKPGTLTVIVNATEDIDYPIGEAVGNLTDILVDRDTSERLSLLISDVPVGIILTSNVSGGVTYLGNGDWQIDQDAIPGLVIPPVTHFSGEDPYPTIIVFATSQEIDSDQATSDQWTLTIDVFPIADGLAGWNPQLTRTEGNNELSNATGLTLSNAATSNFIDNDGSEQIIEYRFNLSSFIDDAQIGQRLIDLGFADLDDIVNNLMTGTASLDVATSILTVLPNDLADVAFDADLFLDSNIDWTFPIEALIRDTATIDGVNYTDDIVETATFTVTFEGTADVPTAFAEDASGNAGSVIPITVGGNVTDTDPELGRMQSEDIFYILEFIESTGTFNDSIREYTFIDSTLTPIGLDNGDGTWIFEVSDLDDFNIITDFDMNGTLLFNWTSVAIDDDTREFNETDFLVTVITVGNGTPPVPPLPPLLEVRNSNDLEDGAVTVNVNVTKDPSDGTNPVISVIFSDYNIPGYDDPLTFNNAVLNVFTENYVASADDVNSGLVSINPPPDFSGFFNVTVLAVARSLSSDTSAVTGPEILTFYVDPVADGPSISLSAPEGLEDVNISTSITIREVDIDGSEELHNYTYILLSDNATLPAYSDSDIVMVGDADEVIVNTSVVGYYRVLTSDLNISSLDVLPAEHWHGDILVSIVACTVEPDDDEDGDHELEKLSTFTISVVAVADPPLLSVPTAVVTDEDVFVLVNMSVTLVDNITDNGEEVISARILNVPEDTAFSSGSNNGDGTWTIPVEDLPTLQVLPPEHFCGYMELTLVGITLELSNADEANSTDTFQVNVTCIADEFLILTPNPIMTSTGIVDLDLNIRMLDTRGTNETGETPEEVITLTFTDVPTESFLLPSLGGELTTDDAGTWIFTGTEAQSNAISLVAGPGFSVDLNLTTVSISGVTTDDLDVLATPITDAFRLVIGSLPTNVSGFVNLTGTTGDDTLTGGDGNDAINGDSGSDTLDGGAGIDRIIGGQGADFMTGGTDIDIFRWFDSDVFTGPDTITDFSTSDGDILDFSELTTTFNSQLDSLDRFIQLVETGGSTEVQVSVNGVAPYTNAVTLSGVTGLVFDDFVASGHILFGTSI